MIKDVEKYYPEAVAAANKDAENESDGTLYDTKRQRKDFTERLRARDTLPPQKRPVDD